MSGVDQPFIPSDISGTTGLPPIPSIGSFGNEPSVPEKPLHRLAEVRIAQGISLNSVAKRFGIEISEAREMERPETDLTLSELYKWQKILDIPIAELLIDPDDLPNNPIRTRGQLVRLMKTARSIRENAKEEQLQILSQMLIDQLIELMPELQHISAWPSIGQSREFKDYGQAIYRRFESGFSSFLEDQ